MEASEGLGNSQKAEVAWLERKGYAYTEVEVGHLQVASVGYVDNTLTFPLWILIGPALIQGSWPSHLLLGGDCAGPLPVLPKFRAK